MKIYMLNPPFVKKFSRCMRWQERARGGTIYYPIWLAYATGLLEKKGHKVRLVDAPARGYTIEWILKDIQAYSPDLVVLETSFTSIVNDLKVAKRIKEENPLVKTVIVGPPASVFTKELISNDFIDFVIKYEYDWTLADLAYVLEKGGELNKIRGLCFKKEGKIINNPPRSFSTNKDLEELPFVSKVYAKHLNILDYYLSSSLYPEVQIFAGRGCPYRCTFCAWPQTFMGRIVRLRSIENVFSELCWIKEHLKYVKEIVFEDDTFSVNKIWVRGLCKKIISEKLDIIWNCQVRADLDYDTLLLMAKAGCRLVIVGFESANQHILNNIKKGITVEQMIKFAENVKRAGILLHADFIFGLPGETRETIKNTIKFIKRIKPDILQISVVAPFPGTELYQWLKERGYLKTENPEDYLDKYGHQKSVVSYPWLTAEEIEYYVNKALRDYYFSVRYIPIVARQIFRKNGFYELKRIIYSAIMFMKYIRHV